MQSELGAALFRHYGLDPEDPTSWLLLHEGQAYQATEAIIRTGMLLGGRWRLLRSLKAVPGRDWAYHLVARYRRRITRPVNFCELPDAHIQKRLLT